MEAITRRIALLVVVACTGWLAACGSASEASAERPTVVVTTNILADVVATIGGQDIEVVDLMPRGADPHSFGLSANETAQIESSDLIVTNGLGLEEGLQSTLEPLRQGEATIVEIAPQLDPIPYGTDDDDGLDPHVWTDPLRMATAATLIADALGEVAPHAADDIDRRATAYIAELVELDRWIEAELADIPVDQRQIVTNHHVFGYFAERYGFAEVGAVIPSGSTLASPSAADLADLAHQIEQAGVSTIFADLSHSTRLADALASEVDIVVEVVALPTETLGEPGSEAATYLGMMRTNARQIVASLR